MALTQEQMDFFAANGYLSCGKIFDDAEVLVLRREYDRIFEIAAQDGSYRNLSIDDTDDKDRKASATKKVFQIMQMCERSMVFRKLLYDARILEMVQDLLGPNIMLFHDQALFKPAHTGGAVFWHQDNAYWKCRPANLVSCWMTFDNAFKENGAMQVIPASHLKPIRHETSSDTKALLNLGESVDASKAVVVDLPAGGCMFHHCQTAHYTQPNTTATPRRAYAIHFMAPGTRSANDGGKTMPVNFKHPMLQMVS